MNNQTNKACAKAHPLFPFFSLGSLIYAFFFTLFLYRNHSGLTYPFFVGGTCLFFFLFLKKCGLTAKNTKFLTVSLILLGISTCMTDSWVLIFLNKVAIFLLFFYMALGCLYETKKWSLLLWAGHIAETIFGSMEFIPYPFIDFSLYQKEKKAGAEKQSKGQYIFYGVLIALPLLFVVLILLGKADAVFGNALLHLLYFDLDIFLLNNVLRIVWLFLFAFFSAYCLLRCFDKHALKENVRDPKRFEPVIAITFTGMLSFIYALFCLVQLVYLFGGIGTLPGNYTYSSYAREGFFQLVFICVLNLTLVLICKKHFGEHKVLKAILTFICVCTYIMIASSAYRMLLYIQWYHLTFLRVFVLWMLVVISFLVTGALIFIYREEFPLVRYFVVSTTLLYLLFSFSHPDYWIARYNIAHSFFIIEDDRGYHYYVRNEHDSLFYLDDLSLDAAPAIFELVENIEADTGITFYDSDLAHSWYDNFCYGLLSISHGNPVDFSPRLYPMLGRQSLRTLNFSRRLAYRYYQNYMNTHPDYIDWM